MNPLTNTRNIKALNENDIKNGIFDHRHTWHSQYKDSAYIFVGGFPYELSEGDLLCVFSQYGEIVNINLVRDKKTGKSQGYGFVCYEDQRSTILAVDNLNSIKLGGRTIRVDHVTNYRPPRSDEKDEEGNYKIKEEKSCAPKTPSPEPHGVLKKPKANKREKKKKKKEKKEKKKKKKKKIDNESDSESTDNEEESRITADLGKMVYKHATKKKPDSQWDKSSSNKQRLNKGKDNSATRRTRSRSRSTDISPHRKIDSCRSTNKKSSSVSTDSEDDEITLGLGKMVYKQGTKKKTDSKWDTSVKDGDILPSERTTQVHSRGRDISSPKKRKRSRSRS